MNTTIEDYGHNLWPPTIRREEIDRENTDLIEDLRTHAIFVCRDSISEDYINQSLEQFTHGNVYYDDSDPKSPIIGVCIWSEQLNRIQKTGWRLSSLYIHLLCASNIHMNIGNKMLFDIETYAIAHNINRISLHAIDDRTVQYYTRREYTLVNNDTLEMSKTIIVPIIHPRQRNYTLRSRNRRATTRRNRVKRGSRAAI